jgi:IgA Peptidase M64
MQFRESVIASGLVPETVMEDLFTRQMNRENEYFAKEKYKDNVGTFEGAGYLAKGLYRPQVDCIMYTRHLVFCKVCRRSVENVIDQYVN